MANELGHGITRKSRKVLLVLANCAAHPHLDSLKNIQLEFLSPSTTSLVQPMDTGIIKNLKTLYRAKLVNYILEAVEENLLTSSSTSKEVSASIDLLHALQFIADSWRRVSTKTFQNCFDHCDFKHSDLELSDKADSENDVILEMHHVENDKVFSCIDSSLQCYNDNEDCEDAVVEQIAAKHRKTSEYQETDEDDTTERERVTAQHTRKFVAGLRLYFMQEGNESSLISALKTSADIVQL
jgi:hypothetical protein